jgi:YbbR domain-containing protein
MMPKLKWRSLYALIVNNWMLKLASIAFAVGLWGFVNLGARESDMSMFVALDLRNLSPTLTITNPVPESVGVRLRGPRTILGTIDQRRQRIQLDLTNVGPGTTSFKIDPEMLNLPRGVTVTRLSPVQVTLDIERLVDKRLPVVTNFSDAVPAGYRVVDPEITPKAVSVNGPASEVGSLRNVPTAPLHLPARSGTFEQSVALERPADVVELSPDRVVVRGRLEEIVIARDIRNVEIGVHVPPAQFRLRPTSVDVTVRGPQRQVKDLRLTSQNFFVELTGITPGYHEAKVQSSLPEGLEVLEIRPPSTVVEVPEPPSARKQRTKGRSRR